MKVGENKMKKSLYDQILIIKYLVVENKQASYEAVECSKKTLKKNESEFNYDKKILDHMLVQTQPSSSDKADSPKSQDTGTVVPENKKSPPLGGGHYMKIVGMWTLKHNICPPKFYELLFKTELKEKINLDVKRFYNHKSMCLNEVTRLQ